MQQAGIAREPRWHAALGVVAALALYLTLPPRLIVGPLWLLPALLTVTLLPLLLLSPHRHEEAGWQRALSIGHIAVLNAFNVATVVLLFYWELSSGRHKSFTGEELLLAAVQIWLTNIIVYALWFWELDGRGPSVRSRMGVLHDTAHCDFLFPQMTLPPDARRRMGWHPQFVDYVYLAFTNATAFSPTDTYPLTRLAKTLMTGEALISLVTIAIIAGRAVNILGNS